MMIKRQKSEEGQVLVLIVLAMVVLLGFTALAVDGGMVYSDRRHAQNAGDAASLAGGSAAALTLENSNVTYGNWNCSNGAIGEARDDAEDAAIDRAGDNGFGIDLDVSDHNGVTTACGEEDHGAWTEKFIDITTEISTTTRTSFAHFVYPGKLQSRIKAVTRVRPRASLGFGNSIVALNEEQSCHGGTPNGVVFEGNVEVQVSGGGVFSNGCIQASGNSFDVNVDCDHPEEGCIVHVGDLETNHVENFEPEPDPGGGLLLPDFALLYPSLENCANANPAHPDLNDPGHPSNEYRTHAGGTFADPEIIRPGNYTNIQMTGAVEMRPGLYCLYGDFDVGNNDLQGIGVTIFMISGSFNVGGGGVVNIHAPTGAHPEPAIPGMLIYMADCSQTTWEYCPSGDNEGTVKLRGNTDSTFEGTIFAPVGRIDIAGTPDVPESVFNTQLIAMDVEIGGNALVDVNFDEDTNFIMPTNLELHR
jgi:hypothetical protein